MGPAAIVTFWRFGNKQCKKHSMQMSKYDHITLFVEHLGNTSLSLMNEFQCKLWEKKLQLVILELRTKKWQCEIGYCMKCFLLPFFLQGSKQYYQWFSIDQSQCFGWALYNHTQSMGQANS